MKTSSIRTLALTAFVTASLGIAGVANAQSTTSGDGSRQGHMMHGNSGTSHMMSATQNLSPEQQETSRKLNEEFFTATATLRQQLATKHGELMAQMHSPNADAAKIEALSKEIGALNGKIMSERAIVNTKLVKAGIPATGHGMSGGMGMGGGMMGEMKGMSGQGCMMMKGMGSMNHGAGAEGQEHTQPAGEQHNQHGQRG